MSNPKHKRVLCPTCKGEKIIPLGGTDEKGTAMDIPCTTCKGEGIVIRYWKVWYQPIKN